jgi:hypothetical protein
MAKDNRLKKGVAVPFDENLLIGKLSGLSRSINAPATVPALEPETAPAAPKEIAPATADAPAAAAAPTEAARGDREGEKTAKDITPVPPASVPVAKSAADGGATPQTPKKPKSGKSWEYGRFLVATDGKKKAHVYITDENHAKIKQVLSLFGNKLAIADYLDNVLAQHWEQFDPEIQERMQQMFSKK